MIGQHANWFWAECGSRVKVASGEPIDHVVSIVPGTVLNVSAWRAFEGERQIMTVYKAVAVNYSSGYAAGWSKSINVDGYTTGCAPQIGQLLAFGTGVGRATYTVIECTDNGANADVTLDHPLVNVLANNDPGFPGPTGAFNWAFHREAVALVSRPLAMPNNKMGVMTQVGVHNDISMRVAMQYQIGSGGTVVNLDLLCGVAMLDARLCVPLLG